MRPLSLYKRNDIYYARFVNPETGERTHGKSTGQKDKDKATYTAMKWLYEGIPQGENKPPRNAVELLIVENVLSQLKEAPFQENDVPRIINTLKARGYIEEAKMKQENRESIHEFLLLFWDFENSPYINDRKAHGQRITKNHCQNKVSIINKYWHLYFSDKLLLDLTRQDLKDFSIWLSEQYKTKKVNGKTVTLDDLLSRSTLNNIIKTGTVALRWASREKRIPENPADGLIMFSSHSKKRGILSDKEVQKLFSQGKWIGSPANKLGNYLAMQTGLRMGEIVALQVKDILTDRIKVSHSWSEIDGLKGTKTQEVREVAILPELSTTLLNHAKLNPNEYGPNSFVLFNMTASTKPHAGKLLYSALRKALDSIGIKETERTSRNINFHSWRHYYARKMVDVLDKRAADLTGHATPEMLQHYANHANAQDFEKAKKATAQVFGHIVPFSQEIKGDVI